MKKKTKEEMVSALKIFLGELREQKISEDGQIILERDISYVKHVIELIEQHNVEKVDLGKYDKISGSEWNEILAK